jgi:hypothetical protein
VTAWSRYDVSYTRRVYKVPAPAGWSQVQQTLEAAINELKAMGRKITDDALYVQPSPKGDALHIWFDLTERVITSAPSPSGGGDG